MKREKVQKEDVTWRINPIILKDFRLISIKKGKTYSGYIEELMKKEIENENKNKD